MKKKSEILLEIDMTKSELKDFIKDTLSDEIKKQVKDGELTDEKKVRNIIKDLLKKHYKTLWTKSVYFTDDL